MPQPAFFGAAWLVDVVIPEVPVRQRVQSLPYRVWALSAYDPAACALVRSVLVRAVAGFYERTARRAGVPRARGGALVFVQRCESRMREIRTSGLTRGGHPPSDGFWRRSADASHRVMGPSSLTKSCDNYPDTGGIWLCAQGWPTKSKIEVAILDEGIGIRRSLAKKFNLQSDEHALTTALQEGASGATLLGWDDPFGFGPQVGVDVDPEDAREARCNSGYGLFVVSEMCRAGGEFLIASGTSCLRQQADARTMLVAAHDGVAVAATLSTAGEGIHKLIQRVATKKYGDTPSTRPRIMEPDP